MKLKNILNEYGNYNTAFFTEPNGFAKWHEQDFADKAFELDFLRKLSLDIDIGNLDYTDSNKAKALVTAGLIRTTSNDSYEMTDIGKKWYTQFNDFKQNVIKDMTRNAPSSGATKSSW